MTTPVITVDGGTIERHGAVLIWGLASVPLSTESQSGDLGVVWSPHDSALIAVVDGAGHGVEAAAAAGTAASIMAPFAHESPVALVLRCHEKLRGTRGAAMTLVSLNLLDRTITWLGIGNVEGVLCHADAENQGSDRVLLRSGVVGYRLPQRLKAEVLPLQSNDTLIIATDGVKPEFAEEAALAGEPKLVAERLLMQYGNNRDDALVLVAKYHWGRVS